MSMHTLNSCDTAQLLERALERAVCYPELSREFVRELRRAIDTRDSVGLCWLDEQLATDPNFVHTFVTIVPDFGSLLLEYVHDNAFIVTTLFRQTHVRELLAQSDVDELFLEHSFTWGCAGRPHAWCRIALQSGVSSNAVSAFALWILENGAETGDAFASGLCENGSARLYLLNHIEEEHIDDLAYNCIARNPAVIFSRHEASFFSKIAQRVGEERLQNIVGQAIDWAIENGITCPPLLAVSARSKTYYAILRQVVARSVQCQSITLFEHFIGEFMSHVLLARGYRHHLYALLHKDPEDEIARYIDQFLRGHLQSTGWHFGTVTYVKRNNTTSPHVFLNNPRGGMFTFVPDSGSFRPPEGTPVMFFRSGTLNRRRDAFKVQFFRLDEEAPQ